MERLVLNADSGCVCERDRQAVLSCTRLLTRILPYIFEDPDWRGFFWSTVPKVGKSVVREISELLPEWVNHQMLNMH